MVKTVFSNTAMSVLERRYLNKDEEGNLIETPEQLFHRVADTLGKNGVQKEQFFRMMYSLDFLPNSPTLMNAGTPLGMLSACFVIPIEDSIESIFDGIKYAAMIHKAGGGTGFSFSRLRPSNDTVKSTSGVSSGPISFMSVYDAATETIKQGGKRRGANMGILHVNHPDIEIFINCKSDLSCFQNFNISVAITDEFMKAVEDGSSIPLINPRTKEIVKHINAKELFGKIVDNSYTTGEPGIVFIDAINRNNPTPQLGEIESTNPCVHGDTLISTTIGEIPIRELTRYTSVDVYTRDKDGELTIRPAKFFRTKTKASIVKVTTSRGEVLCTSDHQFLTPDGWIEAQNLLEKQRLIGLNRRKQNETHLAIGLSGTKYVNEARFIASYYFGDLQGMDVHHVDEDQYHNSMLNFQVLPHWMHSLVSNQGHNSFAEQCPTTGKFLSKEETKNKETNPNQGKIGVNWYVINVEQAGYSPVFDGNVEDTHCYIANGMVVHNCGEQPLLPFESCNLGSINLSHFVLPDGKIDWQGLDSCVTDAVHLMDNVIDVNKYPLPQIEAMTKNTRKIGLGVMGFADMLIKMKVPYTSKKALRIADEVMERINDVAATTSEQLGELFGAYAAAQGGTYGTKRNATRTTIAPTGTISIIAGCSAGVEPLYALAFKRRIMDGDEFLEIHPLFEEAVKSNLSRYKWNNLKEDLAESGKLTEDMIERYGLKEFLDPEVFVTAHDITPDCHLRIQAAFQKHTDNAVSKTINLSKEATIKDVDKIYRQAWKLGLKGVTIYRDGSRKNQVLSTGKTTQPKSLIVPQERPETTSGKTTEIKTGCGKMLVTVNFDETGKMFEVLAQIGRSGGCSTSQSETSGRLISLALRSGLDPKEVVKQLQGIRCQNPVWCKGTQVLSCADAISQVLSMYVDGITPFVDNTPTACPDCGAPIENQGGCDSCSNCGWSRCK